VDTDHGGGLTQIIGGQASQPETSRPVEKSNLYLLYLHATLGIIRRNFLHIFLRHKTRVTELSCEVVYVILHLAVVVELLLVTNSRTDK